MKTVLCILIVLVLLVAVTPALAQDPNGGHDDGDEVVYNYNCLKVKANGHVVLHICHIPGGNDHVVNFVLNDRLSWRAEGNRATGH